MTNPKDPGTPYIVIPLHSPRVRRLLGWTGLVFGALPLLASIPYYLLVRWFLPASEFGAGVTPVAVVWGLVGLVVFGLIALAGDAQSFWRRLLLPVLGAPFAAMLGVMAWVGPVPYLLHVASESQPGEVVATVRNLSDNATRRVDCRRQVELSTGVGVFPHSLCAVPESVFRKLRKGDRVVVDGQASRFGLLGHALRATEPQ